MFKSVGRVTFISLIITSSTLSMRLFGMSNSTNPDQKIPIAKMVLKHKLGIQDGAAIVDIKPYHSAWAFNSTGTKSPYPAPSLETIFTRLVNEEQNDGSIIANFYQFNLYEEAYALCQAKARGVDVNVIFNSGGTTERSLAQLLLYHCKIPIAYYTPDKTLTELGNSFDHAKFAVFKCNKGRAYLSAISKFHDDLNVLEGPAQLSWVGSYNHTENSNKHCFEAVVINSDEDVVHRCEKDLNALKAAQNHTQEKLNALESTHEKLKANEDVPSDNVLHLLHSRILDNEIERFLDEKEIIAFRDFIPTNQKNNALVVNKPWLILENDALASPCCLLKHDETIFILMRNNTEDNLIFGWLLLDGKTSLSKYQGWVPAKSSEVRRNTQSKEMESNIKKHTAYTLKVPGTGSRILISNPEDFFFQATHPVTGEKKRYKINMLFDLNNNKDLLIMSMTGPFKADGKKATLSDLKTETGESFPAEKRNPSFEITNLKNLDIKQVMLTDDKHWTRVKFCDKNTVTEDCVAPH